MAYKIVYGIIRFAFFFVYRIRVSGRENIPSAPFIICANHTSLTDPLVAAIAMTRRRLVHFMAKSEFFDIPVFGWLLRKVKAFPVKRGKSDISAIKNSLRILRQGEILGIFPEGTRVDSFDASEAKTGAAMIAAKAMVPVIPVFISPGRKKLFSSIDVVVGPPIRIEAGKQQSQADFYRRTADEILQRIYNLGGMTH